jgi:hypothetical protein
VLDAGGLGGWGQGGEGDEGKQGHRYHQRPLLLRESPPPGGPRPAKHPPRRRPSLSPQQRTSRSPPSATSHTPRRRPFFRLRAPASRRGVCPSRQRTRMRTSCYGCIVHRSLASRHTFWGIICAEERCLRVAFCVTLSPSLMPALLPRGDESRMDSWRNFLERRQGEVPWDSSTTPYPRSGVPTLEEGP